MGRGKDQDGGGRGRGRGSEHVIRVAMKDGETVERERGRSFMKMRPARHGAFETKLGRRRMGSCETKRHSQQRMFYAVACHHFVI